MANAVSANSWYVDTATTGSSTDFIGQNVQVHYVLVTAVTNASCVLVLSDASASPVKKAEFQTDPYNAATGGSRLFDFTSCPIIFPNGIRATTVTNCHATIVWRQQGKS